MAKKTTYHHGDLHQALLDAALTLLKTQPIEKLSLRGVAKQAGVSHTAPYRHFKDKAALLAAVAEEGFVEFGQYLTRAVEQAEGRPIESLIATGEAYVRFAVDHSTHFRVMFGHFPAVTEPDSTLPATANGTFQILVDVIAAGQAQGLIQAGDPHDLAIGRWAIAHGLAMLLLDGMLGNPLSSPNETNHQLDHKSSDHEAMVRSALESSLAGILVAS